MSAEEPHIPLTPPTPPVMRYDAMLELLTLLEDRTVKAVFRALQTSGLVAYDRRNQVYKVGKECSRERFARELQRAFMEKL